MHVAGELEPLHGSAIMLDLRSLHESRVGHFQPDVADFELDAADRQGLPAWHPQWASRVERDTIQRSLSAWSQDVHCP